MGVNTYDVSLITNPGELAEAAEEQARGLPSVYVTIRASSTSLANAMQQTIEREGYLSRPPTPGELEAVEKGLDAMGIDRAHYGQVTPTPRRGNWRSRTA